MSSATRRGEPSWPHHPRFSYLVFGFQGHRVDHADVVGFGGGVVVVPILDEIAGTIVCEVRYCVVEKGNGPRKEDIQREYWRREEIGNTAGMEFYTYTDTTNTPINKPHFEALNV